MSYLDAIIERCRAMEPHIVLSEGDDARVQEAAKRAVSKRLARITLIGSGIDAPEGIAVIDPAKSDRLEAYAAIFADLRKH